MKRMVSMVEGWGVPDEAWFIPLFPVTHRPFCDLVGKSRQNANHIFPFSVQGLQGARKLESRDNSEKGGSLHSHMPTQNGHVPHASTAEAHTNAHSKSAPPDLPSIPVSWPQTFCQPSLQGVLHSSRRVSPSQDPGVCTWARGIFIPSLTQLQPGRKNKSWALQMLPLFASAHTKSVRKNWFSH